MQPNLKKILRALSLDIRHTLEGYFDNTGVFHPGDLETRLNALGVWRDRPAKPLVELPHLSSEDKAARQVIDAYIAYRAEAEVPRADAVAEFVREAAYNWANRLLALRCMEARGIIDEVILQKEIYGGRSLVHNRLARKNPQACAGPDEGLFAVLFQEFADRARELPELFAPASPAIALRPSLPALKRCLALLSGVQKAGGQEAASDEVFSAPDALGWAYQYWNTEEKDRVFEKVRTQKGAKIEGADIIPATQLYTEPYMVKFLVQNSLGATWMGMHPESKLAEGWEYYVKDADRAPLELKPVQEITLLDPALGSGHFHLEAFDLFFPMYREEHPDWSAVQIAAAILNHNLYGIDIDERAVQIATAALWMKAKDCAPDILPETLTSFHQHLVATNILLPKGKDHLKTFLAKHPEAASLQPALEVIFEGLENVHELGSLVQIEEPVEKELRYLREKYEVAKKRGVQASLFEPTVVQGELPIGVESYEQWKEETLGQLARHFAKEAEISEMGQRFFGQSIQKSISLFELLARRYDVVTANPPYMGSGSMGPIMKSFTETHYNSGKGDLYAAFIIRCNNLALNKGRVALITQQSWMFLRTFIGMRAVEPDKRKQRESFNGILRDTTIELLAHLGPNAFAEISGEVVNTVMFVFQKLYPSPRHKMTSYRLIGPKSSEEKRSLLLQTLNNNNTCRFAPLQEKFLELPQSPLCYWLRDRFFELLSSETLGSIGEVKQGLATACDPRFVHFSWEVGLPSDRWHPYYKGGGYKRWDGFTFYFVEWGNKGARIKARIDPKTKRPFSNVWMLERAERDLFFHQGLTSSLMAQGSYAVRLMKSPGIFSSASPCFFIPDQEKLYEIAGLLNCRITSYLLRALSPELKFRESYVARAPILNTLPIYVGQLSEISFTYKRQLTNLDLIELGFNPSNCSKEGSIHSSIKHFTISKLRLSAIIHSIEACIELDFRVQTK